MRTSSSFNTDFHLLKGEKLVVLQRTYQNSVKISLVSLFVAVFLFHIGAPLSHAAKTYHIAVIITNDSKPYNDALSAFYERLKANNVDYLEKEYLLDKEKEEKIIADLLAFKPDIVHTIGTRATSMAKDKTRDIPIIFSMVLNPVASGLIKSMKASGNNLTGASLDIPHRLQFKRTRDKLPTVKRIGVLYSEEQTGVVVADAERAAKDLGMELVKGKVESPGDVPRELNKLIGKIDVLWSVADTNVFTIETTREILLVTLSNKIPFIGLGPSFIRLGALIAFDPDERDIGRQAAAIAERVLGGENPSKIPVSVPENVELIINEIVIDVLEVDIH